MPKHHHFTPERLLALDWEVAADLHVEYSPTTGSRIDRITPGERADLNGYHQAVFPIGKDEVGYVLIPDTALAMLRALPPDA
jgi:hypothetical protein